MGRLLVVATPLGNLSDLSARAVESLQQASIVFAEDTRVSRPLLERVQSKAKLVALHEHNEARASEQLCAALEQHAVVALVSDAGTPLVSDPGSRAVEAVLQAGHQVVPIPGPSAVTTALCAAGFASVPFAFFGFIERPGKARQQQLKRMAQFPGVLVCFETKHRVSASLSDLCLHLGPERRIAIFRELTKVHEQHYRGTLAAMADLFANLDVKGELTLVVEAPSEDPNTSVEDAEAVGDELANDDRPLSALAKELAERTGMKRQQAYQLLQAKRALKTEQRPETTEGDDQ